MTIVKPHPKVHTGSHRAGSSKHQTSERSFKVQALRAAKLCSQQASPVIPFANKPGKAEILTQAGAVAVTGQLTKIGAALRA